MTAILFDCKDVVKIYESANQLKVPALRGIDLTIREGNLLAIIGPSGAGKTTFLSVLGLLEPFSSGEIIYSSHLGHVKYSEVTRREKTRFYREVFGYLFQLPGKNLFLQLTVFQNILFPLKIAGNLSHEEQDKRVHELLGLLGLEHRATHLSAKLSGGEAQRLGICIALANDPQVLLADEPTGELDSRNTASIIHYFRELKRELGKTIIVVTHDRRFRSSVDITYSIRDGKITSLIRAPDNSAAGGEFTYVSEAGELYLPANLRRDYAIGNMVKLLLAADYVKLLPAGNLVRNQANQQEEYTYVNEDGRLTIPARVRLEIGIKKAVVLESAPDHIKIFPAEKLETSKNIRTGEGMTR